MSDTPSFYDSLLLHVRTKAEADSLISKIEEITSSLYQLNNETFSQIVHRNLHSELAESLYSELIKNNCTFEHPQELKQFLTSLKEILQNMQIVILTISFPPPDELVSEISRKAKSLFGANILVQLQVQESLVGGAVVVVKGKYTDSSVNAKLDKVFQTNSQEIINILRQEEVKK